MENPKSILIIKFGGLGDLILSLDAIFAIIKYHKVKPVILTEKPYNEILKKSKWFNQIITIKRSPFYFYDKFQIKKKIKIDSFNYVYDLQTSKRSSSYLSIFYNLGITTNGIGPFATISHNNKLRNDLHTLERQREQLKLSSVKYKEKTNISWLFGSNNESVPKFKYSLIVPGGSKKRKNKRIPISVFFKIIEFLIKRKIVPLLIGSHDDEEVCFELQKKYPEVKNYCSKTNIFKIAKLSKKAILSLGNDTGPMHIIAKGNKPTFVFFTKYSNPDICSPRGKNVKILNYKNNNFKFINTILKELEKFS